MTSGSTVSPYITVGTVDYNGGGVYNCGGIYTGTIAASSAVYSPTPSEYKYKNLYQVFCVDTDGDIVLDEVTVAKNEEEAKFNAKVYEFLTVEDMSLDDVTVIVRSLGQVKVKA